MTSEQQTVLLIKGAIMELPDAQREACVELAEHIQMMVKTAGDIVGPMALALAGAQAAANAK